MSYKNFRIVIMFVAAFIAIVVSTAITRENPYLAVSAVTIGMISMFLIKKRVKDVMVDEMIENIAGKAARVTYSVTVSVLALLSLIFMFSNLGSKDSYFYNLGIIFSYIVLFSMAIYSFAYYFYRKKYGSNEE